MAHNFGCAHDPRVSSNQFYAYGHGYLMEGGFRTIMAYFTTSHRTRVNYYSNPSVIMPLSNTATGSTGVSINENQ